MALPVLVSLKREFFTLLESGDLALCQSVLFEMSELRCPYRSLIYEDGAIRQLLFSVLRSVSCLLEDAKLQIYPSSSFVPISIGRDILL